MLEGNNIQKRDSDIKQHVVCIQLTEYRIQIIEYAEKIQFFAFIKARKIKKLPIMWKRHDEHFRTRLYV